MKPSFVIDAIPWFVISALVIGYSWRLRRGLFYRIALVWIGVWLSVLGVLDDYHLRPLWLKWSVIGVALVLWAISWLRREDVFQDRPPRQRVVDLLRFLNPLR